MTANRNLYRILLALVFFAGVASILIYPFKLSPPNVTVDVFDRRYACGDCYIRFGISKIYPDRGGEQDSKSRRRPTSPERFDGWDVLVIFNGNDSYLASYQEELFSKDQNCGWPTFHLTGQFKRRLIYSFLHDGDQYDGIYFDAHTGIAVNTAPECKQAKEKQL